ncbi:unnamed protein product [Bursaphelenchus okinawaensis]|uniref:Tyrosyl-DNA phosphodiesterase n=1 Tax=Bursaphelenchus okinawaensis TaxID=465554 RepID=A0A811KW39_9BILA|nr:unnamed protein product [Bursaphelenchus okinawaensis]CAG9112540.1 unnamed protein product [Bursaphelenchus okinawaensis]
MDPQASSSTKKRKIDAESEVKTTSILEGLHYTKVHVLGESYNKNAYSFKEIINAIQPKRSIHFNFCVDFEFVMKNYPSHLRNKPITIITGSEKDVEDGEYLKQHFPNLKVQCASMVSQWGTHHTKLSLFETESGLHVMISTANLIHDDWDHLTQAFYYAYGPYLIDDVATSKRTKVVDNFGDDLKKYIRTAYLNPGLKILNRVQDWSDIFAEKLPDFSHIKDRLVYSIPGKEWVQPMGYVILRDLLKDRLKEDEIKDCTFVTQISSIGSLGQSKHEWLCREFGGSLCGKTSGPKDMNLKIVYPSMQTMADSVDGWLSGGSFPWSDNIYWRQKWMNDHFCDWKSDHLGRTRCMPHIKSYAVVTSDDTVKWLLITSANLSKAAWGRLNNNGRTTFVHSYELGVLMLAENSEAPLQLPYDWPLKGYSNTDTPFRRNARTNIKDCEGREYPYTQ